MFCPITFINCIIACAISIAFCACSGSMGGDDDEVVVAVVVGGGGVDGAGTWDGTVVAARAADIPAACLENTFAREARM